MSLLEAKRIADLNESIEAESLLFNQKHDGFRKSINDELSLGFRQKMEDNGFQVSNAHGKLIAEYKGIKVELVLASETDRFIGIYHSFEISVNGNKWFVRVLPKFEGGDDSDRFVTGQTAEILSSKLAALKNNVANLRLLSYELGYQQEKVKKSTTPPKVSTIGEVLEAIVA